MTSPIQGQQFDPEEKKRLEETAEYWRKVGNEAPVEALTRIEDAAKQMIIVTTSLQGLYIALFVFSTIRAQIMTHPGGILGTIILFVFSTPLWCWLISLRYATRVFVPHVQPEIDLNTFSASQWTRIRDAYRDVNTEKLRWLHRSHRWLLIAILIFILVMLLFLLFIPVMPTDPTQIIIVKPIPKP